MLLSLLVQCSALVRNNTTYGVIRLVVHDRGFEWKFAPVLLVALLACGTRAGIVATNPSLALSPTCADAVRVYADRDNVPYDYYEVALVTASGNSVYTGNGDILKAMRSKAASVGANGLVINLLGATHATVKVIGAAVGGNDAERKGQAIAIWMPSDTARVREACGK